MRPYGVNGPLAAMPPLTGVPLVLLSSHLAARRDGVVRLVAGTGVTSWGKLAPQAPAGGLGAPAGRLGLADALR